MKHLKKGNQNNENEFWQTISTGFMVSEKTLIDRAFRILATTFSPEEYADFKWGRGPVDSQ